jgi:hypothetical protein
MADACIRAYLKATVQAQSATKQAIRDWKQNLDRKASAEFSSGGTLALQDAMETQVRLDWPSSGLAQPEQKRSGWGSWDTDWHAWGRNAVAQQTAARMALNGSYFQSFAEHPLGDQEA